MARRKQPISAGRVLDRFAKRRHMDREFRRYELAVRWHELVGGRIAGRTSPGRLKDGQLVVYVNDSAWFNELTFLKEQLVEEINARLGERRVRGIRLVAGKAGTPAPPPEPEPERPSLVGRRESEGQAQGEVPRLTDDELRQRIVSARAAQLTRES